MDDDVVWLDYHRDEIDKRNRRIKELEDELTKVKDKLWIAEEWLKGYGREIP